MLYRLVAADLDYKDDLTIKLSTYDKRDYDEIRRVHNEDARRRTHLPRLFLVSRSILAEGLPVYYHTRRFELITYNRPLTPRMKERYHDPQPFDGILACMLL